MTKILIVNPNTTTSMTETIGAAARAVAAPGTEISAVTSAMGPVSIEGYYDEAFAVPGLIQALMNAPDADAAIVACFDDTGLDAARTAAHFPVVGICEAALVTAGQIAKRIAIVTTLPRSIVPLAGTGAPLWFCGEGCRSPPATSRCSISKSPARVRKKSLKPRLPVRSTRARRRSCWAARAWPILQQKLSQKFGVPVVDGVAAAVKQAEALAGLKLTTSRRGSYASPGVKKYEACWRRSRQRPQTRVRTH